MPTSNTKELEDLIREVAATPGWEVKDFTHRWRITNSAGGGPAFVSKRPPASNTLKSVVDLLVARGWDADKAAQAREAERLHRIEADRLRNEKAMSEAVRAAERAELEGLREAAEQRSGSVLLERSAEANKMGDGTSKEVISIDAAFARELLQYNHFFDHRGQIDLEAHTNRPIDWDLVKVYRDDMLRGDWKRSHQGLGFDVDMNLVDGQHRLLAVIEADKMQPGTTFTTEVTYDLERDVFAVVDVGKKRTTSDILALHNLPNRIALAAALKLVYMYERIPYGMWSKTKVTPQQTLRLLGEYGLDLRDAVRRAASFTKLMIPSSVGAGVYLARKAMPGVDMDDFLYGLRTGADLSDGDPRLALRGFMDRLRAQRRRSSNNIEQLGLFIKTWNAYVEGRPVYQIRLRANEQFPRPIEKGTLEDLKQWEARHAGDGNGDVDSDDE